MTEKSNHMLRAADIVAMPEVFSHPWNPKSEIHGMALGRALGLKRTGVSLAMLPPGKESFLYHSHHYEEEWLYFLSGRGQALIDGQTWEVGAGDFLAFPTPSVAHHLTNPFEAPLVYLTGGENREFEVVEFPLLGRRMVRRGQDRDIYRSEDAQPFTYGRHHE